MNIHCCDSASAACCVQEGPGPGQYGSPGPATGTGGPAWTLLGKVAPPKKTNEEGPAPGDYAAVDPGPTGPAWTLTGKQKGSRKKEDEPGPGEHQHMFSGPNGVAWSFGKKLKKGGGRRRSSDKGAGERVHVGMLTAAKNFACL